MAIKGITDSSRPPRIAKIRLGDKTAGDSGYPRAWDHYNFVDCPELEEVFGKDCRTISPIYFPSDDEEVFCPTALKAWRKTGLFCRGDGEIAHRAFNPQDEQGVDFAKQAGVTPRENEFFEIPCLYQDCPYYKRKLCKENARLLFFIARPEIQKLGIYEISTSSVNGMQDILSYTRFVRSQRQAAGGPPSILGVPFSLRLVGKEVSPDGRRKTVYVLQLTFEGSYVELAQKGLNLPLGAPTPLLLAAAPPEELPPDDLYPEGGAQLDRMLNGEAAPAARPAPAPEPAAPAAAPAVAPTTSGEPEARAEQLGKQLGLTAAQITIRVAKAKREGHLADLIDDMERTLEAKGPAAPTTPATQDPYRDRIREAAATGAERAASPQRGQQAANRTTRKLSDI